MAAGRVLLLLGLACFVASAYGQGSLLQQVADGNYSGGNYLVNGTGFVYNDTALTIYLNNTAVGTIPYGETAEAPGKDENDFLHKDKDGVYTFDFTKDDEDDKDDKDDKDNKDDKDDKDDKDNKDDKDDKDDKHDKDENTAPAPGVDEDVLITLLGEILDNSEKDNPLDKVIIGRKMLL